MVPYECRMKFRMRFRGSRLRPPRDSILRERGLIERGWLLRDDSTCVGVLGDSGRCVVALGTWKGKVKESYSW